MLWNIWEHRSAPGTAAAFKQFARLEPGEFWPDSLFPHALQSSIPACIRHNSEHSPRNLYPTLKRLPQGLDQV